MGKSPFLGSVNHLLSSISIRAIYTMATC
jgi:hypothetical protein